MEAIRRRGLARNIQMLRGQITLMEKDGEALIPILLRLAEEVGVSVNSVSLRKPSLDDVFLYFTGERIRSQGPEPMMMWRMRMMRRGR